MAATRSEVIDYLAALTDDELDKIVTEARDTGDNKDSAKTEKKDLKTGRQHGNTEADKRFGKKGA
ncbi:hypothetical protein GTA09_15310 [Rhodococcus hoagii]|nr:hypothetical protein [Prescottella equi]NKZ71063.1 hypothetical protein [Prescottella equi]